MSNHPQEMPEENGRKGPQTEPGSFDVELSELESRLIDYLGNSDALQSKALGNSFKAALHIAAEQLQSCADANSPTINAAINLIHSELRNAEILEHTKGMVLQA